MRIGALMALLFLIPSLVLAVDVDKFTGVTLLPPQNPPIVAKLSPMDVYWLDFSKLGVDTDGDGFKEAIVEVSVPSMPKDRWMDIFLSTHYGRGKISATLITPTPINFEKHEWGNNIHVRFRIPNVPSGTYRVIIEEKEKNSLVRIMVPIYEIRDNLIIPIPGIGAPAKWSCRDLYTDIDEKGFSPAIWEISPQVITVNPGEEFDLRIKFTIRQFSYFPSHIIWQVFLLYSWSPTWPPKKDYYVALYDGIPSYTGPNVVKTVRVKAPQSPGEYYIWVGMCQYYGVDLVVRDIKSKPPLPAHVKVIVRSTTPTPAQKTTLKVDSSPSGAEVYINGVHRGITPLTLSLDAGKYRIDIKKSGYRDYTTNIDLLPGETKTITAILSKQMPEYAKFAYISDEIEIPKGTFKRFTVEGSGRALIIKAESTDRIPLLGFFIKNKYQIKVYRNGVLIEPMGTFSRIDSPGDPTIWEIVVEPGNAIYDVVVTTKDVGCFLFACNGDKTRVQILLGSYTTEWAKEMNTAYDSAQKLWIHPTIQFAADYIKTALKMVGIPVDYRDLVEKYTYDVVDVVSSAVFGVGISSIAEAWKTAVEMIEKIDYVKESANLASRFENEQVPFRVRECPVGSSGNCGGLREFYNEKGFSHSCYVATPPIPMSICHQIDLDYYDYIRVELGFMKVATEEMYSQLKAGNYSEALYYMNAIEEFRPHLEWIVKDRHGLSKSLGEPWNHMFNLTRAIVMLDYCSWKIC